MKVALMPTETDYDLLTESSADLFDVLVREYKGQTSAEIAVKYHRSSTEVVTALQGLFDHYVSVIASDPLQTTQNGLDARRKLGWLVCACPWLCL